VQNTELTALVEEARAEWDPRLRQRVLNRLATAICELALLVARPILRDSALAQDAANDTWLKMQPVLLGVDYVIDHVEGYTRKVARNCALAMLRKRKEILVASPGEDLIDEQAGLDTEAALIDQQSSRISSQQYREALGQLTEKDRELLEKVHTRSREELVDELLLLPEHRGKDRGRLRNSAIDVPVSRARKRLLEIVEKMRKQGMN
jgi:DNA-directed RNA polymerase specialized sigma24 family protein